MDASAEMLNTRGVNYKPPSMALSTLGIVHLVFRKSFQMKSIFGLGLSGLVLGLFASLAIGDNGRQSYAEYANFMYGLFLLKMLPFFTLVTAGGVLRNEIKDGTLEYIWTRPISRMRTIAGLFASAVLVTFTWAFVMSLGIQAGAIYDGVAGIWTGYGRLLLGIFACISAFSGLALLVGAYSGKFVGLGIVYIGVVEMGISRIPTNINNIAITHHIESIVAPTYTGADGSAFSGFLGSILIAAGLAFLAGLVFRNKSYSLGSEKEE